METVGHVCWCEAWIRHPAYLDFESFEAPLECRSLIIADNVDGCGSFIFLDARTGAIYFFCSGPYYALVAGSFEDWILGLTKAWLKDEEPPGYEPLIAFSWWPKIKVKWW